MVFNHIIIIEWERCLSKQKNQIDCSEILNVLYSNLDGLVIRIYLLFSGLILADESWWMYDFLLLSNRTTTNKTMVMKSTQYAAIIIHYLRNKLLVLNKQINDLWLIIKTYNIFRMFYSRTIFRNWEAYISLLHLYANSNAKKAFHRHLTQCMHKIDVCANKCQNCEAITTGQIQSMSRSGRCITFSYFWCRKTNIVVFNIPKMSMKYMQT